MAIPVRLGGYQEMYQDKKDRICGVFKQLARDWGISEEEGWIMQEKMVWEEDEDRDRHSSNNCKSQFYTHTHRNQGFAVVVWPTT